jgi:hypothetical protein
LVVFSKISVPGSITIPEEIRGKIILRSGDLARIELVGHARLIIDIISTLSLEEILARYHSDEPVDMARLRAEGEEDAANQAIATMSQ